MNKLDRRRRFHWVKYHDTCWGWTIAKQGLWPHADHMRIVIKKQERGDTEPFYCAGFNKSALHCLPGVESLEEAKRMALVPELGTLLVIRQPEFNDGPLLAMDEEERQLWNRKDLTIRSYNHWHDRLKEKHGI